MKRIMITEKEYVEVREAERATKNKYTSKKFRVLMLRYEGKNNQEIAQAIGYCVRRIS